MMFRSGGSAVTEWCRLYKLVSRKCQDSLRLTDPVREAPELRVPPGELHALELHRGRRDAVAPEDRYHHDALDDQIVHPDEQGRPLDGIELGVGRAVQPVVLLRSEERRVGKECRSRWS